MPPDLLRYLCEYCPGEGHCSCFDYKTARALAGANQQYYRYMRAEILVHRLTVRGLPGDVGPRLRLMRGGYAAPNQISTYELLGRLQPHYRLSDKTLSWLDRHLAACHARGDRTYGEHAGLNQWSPSFSRPQLRALAQLIFDTRRLHLQAVARPVRSRSYNNI